MYEKHKTLSFSQFSQHLKRKRKIVHNGWKKMADSDKKVYFFPPRLDSDKRFAFLPDLTTQLTETNVSHTVLCVGGRGLI